MKFLIVLSLLVVALAEEQYHYGTGTSAHFRSQEPSGTYKFGYYEGHPSGGTFRKEIAEAGGKRVGIYGLADADGRRRVVNYVADGSGFRASVHSNEPGVDSKDPAAVSVNKDLKHAVPVGLFAAYGHHLANGGNIGYAGHWNW